MRCEIQVLFSYFVIDKGFSITKAKSMNSDEGKEMEEHHLWFNRIRFFFFPFIPFHDQSRRILVILSFVRIGQQQHHPLHSLAAIEWKKLNNQQCKKRLE